MANLKEQELKNRIDIIQNILLITISISITIFVLVCYG